jgi:predicted nucleic acid-binding protein
MSERRVYFDACVAIYYVERHALLYPQIAAALFPDAGDAPVPVFSDLTRMECRVLPMRRQDSGLLARYDAFFALPDCRRAALDTPVLDLATELRAAQNLKTPDALHLAAAIRSGCAELWTNDARFAAAAAGHLGTLVFDEATSGSHHV